MECKNHNCSVKNNHLQTISNSINISWPNRVKKRCNNEMKNYFRTTVVVNIIAELCFCKYLECHAMQFLNNYVIIPIQQFKVFHFTIYPWTFMFHILNQSDQYKSYTFQIMFVLFDNKSKCNIARKFAIYQRKFIDNKMHCADRVP